ncbi:hypothetical protein ZWY2020_051149 [Hordeum vulgare]|nr:hypothetical protein ZWY2020_051149 [Hordeum vulgare]
MDMMEHDPPSFGNFQKKLKATTIISKFASGVGTLLTEFESGVDKLLAELVQGLTAPTTSNSSNSRINSGADTGEREDTLSEDSSSSEYDDGTDEDDADIEREKKKRNTREEHINSGNDESPLMRNETESCDKTLSGDPSAQFDTKSPSGATSQLNLPSDSDVCSSKNNSPTDTLVNSQELEQKIRGVETGTRMFEYPMSEKLTAFLATGDQDEMDADLAEELDDYESHLVDFFKQKRAPEATATAARSNDMAGDAGVQSVTPKLNPHKGRVKKPSRFQLSPYDDEIKVSNEEEDVYAKLMLSSKFKRNGNSTIKNVIIIKYEKSSVYTWDLADSSYITGELSANCAEVGIEYLQETNKVEGKLILSHFVAKFLLQGEHAKKIVTNIFERKKDFAPSCQNLIMFPVIEEIGVNIV